MKVFRISKQKLSSTIFIPSGFLAELDNSSKGNRLYLKYPQGQAFFGKIVLGLAD